MDTAQDDALTLRSTKSLQEKNQPRLNEYRKRKKLEMEEHGSKKPKTTEREKKCEPMVKQKNELPTNADTWRLLQRPWQTTAEHKKLQSSNEPKCIKELKKRKQEQKAEAKKAKLKKEAKERKRRQRQLFDDNEDILSFPNWIENEIEVLEKELKVRPRKIKLWEMTEEQLEEKRKYEREKQRRQRAKIKAQKSNYDPLDLLQVCAADINYDDDEGCVQHLWRPDVE